MMDRAKHRRDGNMKSNKDFTAKGILDVIKDDYTDRYVIISKDFNRIKTLFSEAEWQDILIKSRRSHESKIKRLKRQENIK